jgi:HD-GYP domain-containing protein (c-di-GMP phosphodiesterase class II)
MGADSQIRVADLVACLSDAMDFISPAVVNHHKQVSYIAFSIGTEMGLPQARQKELVLAGSLHDAGAFSLKERMDTLAFEMRNPHRHAGKGFELLRSFEPLSEIAPIVRFHHLPWNHGRGAEFKGQRVPSASHILHLADRVAILIDRKHEVLTQVPSLCARIRDEAGTMFMPQAVDAFMSLASREYFWLDAISPALQSILSHKLKGPAIGLNSEGMMGFSRLFSRIIDFKSPFTAAHSSGVAACAELLSGFVGFTESERRLMRIAGYLHDLGKLAVPVEILDKPSGLKGREFNVIRHHTFYTYRILETIPSFRIINQWASFHHERLDGSGYPFHMKAGDLPLGSQIMAVADVFTAITEDRPYRDGMTTKNAVKVLDGMALNSALSKDIVAVLKNNCDAMNTARMNAQASATKEYKGLALRIKDER